MKDKSHLEKIILDLCNNRSDLLDMLKSVIEIRNNMKNMIPKDKDFRSKFAIENKMNAIVSIIKAELDIRKQIDSSLKTELDMRTKDKTDDSEDEIFTRKQLREIVEKLDEEEKERENSKKIKVIEGNG